MTKKVNFISSISAAMGVVFVGKILGLIKQAIIAATMGTSIETDLFFASYSFINGLAAAIFSAFSIVLLNAYNKANNQADRDTLFCGILKCGIPIAVIITIFMIITSDIFALILAPGFNGDQLDKLSTFISFLSPTIILFSIQYILTAILESKKKFIPGKSLAVILNILLIIAAIFFFQTLGVNALLIAVPVALIIQILISLFTLRGEIHFVHANPLKDKRIKHIFMLLLPLFAGNAINEINIIADRSIASNLGEGSISAITYAASINEVVVVLVINTIASVFYSYISTIISSQEIAKAKRYMFKTIVFLASCLVPISIILTTRAQDIIALLYQRGAFDAESTRMTSMVVMGYAIGFIPTMLSTMLAKVHYAFDDTKKPMIGGILAIIVNIILSIVLSDTIGIVGISLGTTAASIVLSVFMCFTIKKHLTITSHTKIFMLGVKFLVATSISAVVALVVNHLVNVDYILNITTSTIATILTFVGSLYLMRVNILKDTKTIFRTK